ncbi:MAG: cupredoxin domain-containing protein [Candidatus Dormibacteraeota bacterium]|uniref:Cupredoxin domain-containing protein n=1 Tax=Candidatus Dormiibacter inghamiae TaxID=3127013 RepID=A0A934KE58_9BACT|nr:cupredoxin domain-containing protein [Candidatus Dormibacteraeota bacterium]MBJ7605390.1 cupredoxin domain-containing protein [Candidatus Dormibacteraeota bacterium]
MHRFLLLPLAVLVIAACGGGSSGSGTAGTSAPSATTSPTPTAQVVTIHETEFKLDPALVTVKAGTITFNLMDDGKFPHDLHIAPKGTTNDVGAAQRMTAGGMTSFTVTLQAGTYDMWCAVDSHRQQGMQGTITVT